MQEQALLVVGILILSFTVASLSKLLDCCLDYGHIFGEIRFRKAQKSAKEQGMDELLKEMEDAKSLSFHQRVEKMDLLYWQIAKDDKVFLKWVCPFCITTRMSLVANLVFSAFLFWQGYMAEAIPTFLFGMACTFYLSQKI